MDDRVPEPVRQAAEVWLALHDRDAPGIVEGMYLVGSVALDDWQDHSDVDVVAFVADPTDADVVARLESTHDAFRAEPGRPVLDGPFLAWVDVSSAPLAMQRPWSLDGDFRFDGECFEINPVTWFTLATSGVTVRGPSASELDVVVDDGELRSWVRVNVDTYWRGVLAQIDSALDVPARQEFDASILEWCALGLARMSFTFLTGDVTSKSGAGEWAIERHPEHRDVLDTALEVRRGNEGPSVARATVVELSALMADLIAQMTGR